MAKKKKAVKKKIKIKIPKGIFKAVSGVLKAVAPIANIAFPGSGVVISGAAKVADTLSTAKNAMKQPTPQKKIAFIQKANLPAATKITMIKAVAENKPIKIMTPETANKIIKEEKKTEIVKKDENIVKRKTKLLFPTIQLSDGLTLSISDNDLQSGILDKVKGIFTTSTTAGKPPEEKPDLINERNKILKEYSDVEHNITVFENYVKIFINSDPIIIRYNIIYKYFTDKGKANTFYSTKVKVFKQSLKNIKTDINTFSPSSLSLNDDEFISIKPEAGFVIMKQFHDRLFNLNEKIVKENNLLKSVIEKKPKPIEDTEKNIPVKSATLPSGTVNILPELPSINFLPIAIGGGILAYAILKGKQK